MEKWTILHIQVMVGNLWESCSHLFMSLMNICVCVYIKMRTLICTTAIHETEKGKWQENTSNNYKVKKKLKAVQKTAFERMIKLH